MELEKFEGAPSVPQDVLRQGIIDAFEDIAKLHYAKESVRWGDAVDTIKEILTKTYNGFFGKDSVEAGGSDDGSDPASEGDDESDDDEQPPKSWRELKYRDVKRAVKKGDPRAKTPLAWLLLSGLGGADVDEDSAVALLEERVKDRDSEAMWILGLCKEYGLGTEQDFERAEGLYRRSRRGGNNIGRYLLWLGSKEGLHRRGSRRLKILCL